MSNLPAYRKSIAGFLASLATWGYTASADGIQGPEWWGLLGVIAATLAVFGVTNEPDPSDRDGGQGTVDFVIKVMLVVILVIFALALLGRR